MIDNYYSLDKVPVYKLMKQFSKIFIEHNKHLLEKPKQLFIVSKPNCDYITFLNEVNIIADKLKAGKEEDIEF